MFIEIPDGIWDRIKSGDKLKLRFLLQEKNKIYGYEQVEFFSKEECRIWSKFFFIHIDETQKGFLKKINLSITSYGGSGVLLG